MEGEPLQPRLAEAQRALQMALDEACEVDLSEIDTGELIRIEETLAAASKAAKEAVSVRLRMRSERAKQGGRRDVGSEDGPVTHRVFDDIRGVRWHAYAVRSTEQASTRAGLPDAFRHGWLVFESKDELRRIAPIPERWEEFSSDQLQQLCHKAVGKPRKTL